MHSLAHTQPLTHSNVYYLRPTEQAWHHASQTMNEAVEEIAKFSILAQGEIEYA